MARYYRLTVYISLHFSPQSRGVATDLETVDMIVEHALAADAAGVSAISLTEHHLGGFNTYCDPMLMGAHLAGRLTQAYLALNVVQVPMRHPVQIAEHCNILDLMARGRCVITLAPGSVRAVELDAFGVEKADRYPRLEQGVDVVQRLWDWNDGDDPVEFDLGHVRGRVAGRISPSSYRLPHPLIARATATPQRIVGAARDGVPLMLASADPALIALYRSELAAAGHPPETVAECLSWLGLYDVVSLAPTEQAAREQLEGYLSAGGAGPIVTAAYEGSQEWADTWREREQERLKWSLALTPEALVERILGYRDQQGLEHATVALSYVPGERQLNDEMCRLFIEEVLPHVDVRPLPGPTETIASLGASV